MVEVLDADDEEHDDEDEDHEEDGDGVDHRKAKSTQWFRDLYGFEEGPSFAENQANFSMDGETLVCLNSPFPRQHVGLFETPSLEELRARVRATSVVADTSTAAGGLTFTHLPTPEGVVPLILDPDNANAVFQAVRASLLFVIRATFAFIHPDLSFCIFRRYCRCRHHSLIA